MYTQNVVKKLKGGIALHMAKKFRAVFLTLCMLIGLAPTTVLADDPTVSYTAAWNDDGTAITLTVDPDMAGTVYYAVQESGAAAPVDVTGNATACTAGTNTITIAQSTQTAKDIYVKYIDEDGNQYATSSLSLAAYGTATTEVSEGPVSIIEKGTITIEESRLTATSVTLRANSTVDGYLYYVVKPSSETAPSDEAILSGTPVQLTADTPVSFTVTSVSSEELTAYFRFVDADGNVYSGTTTVTIPAYSTSEYSARLESYSSNLGSVLVGYSTVSSLTLTITNTGTETLSFTSTNSDTNFTVNTDNAQNIAAGSTGTVTVTPVTGLSAGTYSTTFNLTAPAGDSDTITLGPVTVTFTVAESGDSTPDDVRIPSESEYIYTPSRTSIRNSALQKYTIGSDVVYCVNYYYTIGSNLSNYYHQFGLISDVTTEEMYYYTGLNPNSNPLYYPPNIKGYVPLKPSSEASSSTVLANIAKVLYYGYPYDAMDIGPADDGSNQNYSYELLIDQRKEYAFMIATQCAIWYYTDGIDYSNVGDWFSSDDRITHLKEIYGVLPVWGWEDVENIFKWLVGISKSSRFDSSVVNTSTEAVPDEFQVDLYIANNPVNTVDYGYQWVQNLVTARLATTTTTTTTSVSVTKNWEGEAAESVTVELYRDGVATGSTLTLDSSNQWTDSFDELPVADSDGNAYTYTVQETVITGSTDSYATTYTGSQSAGFTITNTNTSETVDVSVTKQWVGDEADSITVNLLADETVVEDYAGTVITERDSDGNLSYTFTDLPKYNTDGTEIVYSVVETATSGDNSYQSIVTGGKNVGGDYEFIITNSNHDTTSLTVEKKWLGTEGDAVTVDLYQVHTDGSKTLIQQKQITSDMDWTYTFTDLSTYDSSSNVVVSYEIEEEDADGYQLVQAVDDDGTVILTNIELTELTVTKEWEGQTGEYADVNLLKNGEVTDTVRLTEDNDWTYTWTDLPKYDADTGDEISYSVSEVSMSGYTVTITKISDQEFLINNKWVQTEKPTQERHIVPNTADAPLTDTE